ncbi:MAG TPA: DUF4013 domain-containing protein [Syntrophorhabdaceae bacterium]|nr:DUF4013 domain-containing protein [Syntrophorhabdaceae bacterium]
MDMVPFVQLTLNSRYIARWIFAGLILYIPVLNFLSLGFLSRTSRLVIVGSGIGLPTWQEKYEIWIEGVKLLFIFILYNAIPFFMFSSGFFLTTLNSFTAFFGHIFKILSFVALIVCSFLVPFAFVTFAEHMDFRRAFEFETIFAGIKQVFFEYLIGYGIALCGLYVCVWIMRIPYLGFICSSIISYYILLVSAYYFTELYKKTRLSAVQAPTETELAKE